VLWLETPFQCGFPDYSPFLEVFLRGWDRPLLWKDPSPASLGMQFFLFSPTKEPLFFFKTRSALLPAFSNGGAALSLFFSDAGVVALDSDAELCPWAESRLPLSFFCHTFLSLSVFFVFYCPIDPPLGSISFFSWGSQPSLFPSRLLDRKPRGNPRFPPFRHTWGDPSSVFENFFPSPCAILPLSRDRIRLLLQFLDAWARFSGSPASFLRTFF